MTGVSGANMPPELRLKVLLRAGELYQASRNAAVSLSKALEEVAQINTVPGYFSDSKAYGDRVVAPPAPAAPAIVQPQPQSAIDESMFAPSATPSSVFTAPDANPMTDPSAALPRGASGSPDAGGVEGEIQKSKKTGEMRIMRNGRWVPYAP
jgi:hypothetical protein